MQRSLKCFSRNCMYHDGEAPAAASVPWIPLALDDGPKLDQLDDLPSEVGLWSQMRELGVISNWGKQMAALQREDPPPHSTAEALRATMVLIHQEVQWVSSSLCSMRHHLTPHTSYAFLLFCCFLGFLLRLALGYFNFTQNNLEEWKALLKMLQSVAMKH